jgi:hypothetical protein
MNKEGVGRDWDDELVFRRDVLMRSAKYIQSIGLAAIILATGDLVLNVESIPSVRRMKRDALHAVDPEKKRKLERSIEKNESRRGKDIFILASGMGAYLSSSVIYMSQIRKVFVDPPPGNSKIL